MKPKEVMADLATPEKIKPMKIVIPMAGMGKRMRPHTLTVPKPLIPVAGKPIVQWLVEDLAKVCGEKIEDIGFIVGRFGEEAEKGLVKVAESLGAKGHIFYQDEALGTAHAIMCAEKLLDGKVTVAFADTLFKADFKMDTNSEGIIWVHRVEDPKAFGVVKTTADNVITDFIEKPQEFISDKAIIGIYYFKDGAYLKSELKYLLDNNIKEKGEFQLTNALENMKNKGTKFTTGAVTEWLDCGNKNATVYTNQRMLEFKRAEFVKTNFKSNNSQIIEPCFIGEGVEINNSIVGPHVSIGNGCKVNDSVLKNSIVQGNTQITKCIIENSLLGNFVELKGKSLDLSVGDYSVINN